MKQILLARRAAVAIVLATAAASSPALAQSGLPAPTASIGRAPIGNALLDRELRRGKGGAVALVMACTRTGPRMVC